MSATPVTNEGKTPLLTRGRWIEEWDPEDEQFWETEGKQVARKNLIFSIFAEHIGFSIWVIWTILVLNLGNIGIQMDISESFMLTLVPNLIGSFLRIPYTFAVPYFGGRTWTAISASLLLLPVMLIMFLVPSGWLADQSHDTQYWILLACAATAGFGGGNFSSSMANISFFYPEGKKGLALGLNAAGGNLGVAVAQLLVPLVLIIGLTGAEAKAPVHDVEFLYAGLLFLPLILGAVFFALRYMDSLRQAKPDTVAWQKALKEPQTWIMSILYIGTFGSFIGFSFAFPLLIKNTFPEFLADHQFIATYLAGMGFLGALIGSMSRPFGGWLSDRLGGARVTLGVFMLMAVFTLLAIVGVNNHDFTLFFVSFMFIFFLAGAGNGSTYRMIPSIFATLGKREAAEKGLDMKATAVAFKRRAAAVIGIAGAVGAFGGVLIQVVLRQASLDVAAAVKAAATPAEKAQVAAAQADWSVPALWVFFGAYFVFAAMTWFFYLRRATAESKVPSLAGASI